MRALIVVLCLVLVGAGALAARASQRVRAHPSLIVSTQPAVRIEGVGFKRHERVKVTLVSSGRRDRHVTASSSGGFSLTVGGVRVGRCGGFSVSASGSLGSTASAHIQRPACMPVAAPS